MFDKFLKLVFDAFVSFSLKYYLLITYIFHVFIVGKVEFYVDVEVSARARRHKRKCEFERI